MSSPDRSAPAGDAGGARRRGSTVARLAGGLAALAVVLVLLAWPLHLHPFDRWLHAAVGGGSGATVEAQGGAAAVTLYTCPMHPDILSHEPGTCPICGMDLVPVKDAGGAAAAASTAPAAGEGQAMDMGASAAGAAAAPATAPSGQRKILFYRNPMDPSITSPVPRKDDMGMDYVPVYADEAAGAAAQGAVVTIDPAVVQNMNVTVEPVRRQDLAREIRTVGYLDYDQQKMVSVTTKYSGFIEKVFVNYLGQPVRRGEPLFRVYSPELVQTEQELLSSRDYAAKMKDAPADAAARARALYQAVRTRLGYWDISRAQIEELERSGQVFRTLTVTAPASGVVMQRMDGLDGMAIKPGMELMHIADLSDLWVTVQVYENQLPWVREGSEATITLDYLPGESFTGKVRYVEPQVSEKTRSLPFTLEVPNPDGRLRAGMYATVQFQPVVAAGALVVPSQAVLRTGQRDLVVVALGGGRFAPREVTLGPAGDGLVQVLSGLQEGEQVVTSSQFLIDSESNLRAAIQKLVAARGQGS